jgi:hypothetical protein
MLASHIPIQVEWTVRLPLVWRRNCISPFNPGCIRKTIREKKEVFFQITGPGNSEYLELSIL